MIDSVQIKQTDITQVYKQMRERIKYDKIHDFFCFSFSKRAQFKIKRRTHVCMMNKTKKRRIMKKNTHTRILFFFFGTTLVMKCSENYESNNLAVMRIR